MAYMEMNHRSEVLQMDMTFAAVIPDQWSEKGKKTNRPVIWLLHGGYGNYSDWIRNTNAVKIAEEKGVAMIFPEAHHSCFVNMKEGARYGDYIGWELPEFVKKLFPMISRERKDWHVCGFSNGGYGCIQVALTHSEIFGNAGAFAAGDMEDKPYRKGDDSNWSRNRRAIMGTGDIHETEYSLKYCARRLMNTDKSLPKIYHACGRLDPWYDMNQKVRRFFEGLDGNPYQYYYEEYPEHGHTYSFIEQALKDYIRAVKICCRDAATQES